MTTAGEIGNMRSLQRLNINSNNLLNMIPVELTRCHLLNYLNIENCPLYEIPSEYVQGGPQQVLIYLSTISPYR